MGSLTLTVNTVGMAIGTYNGVLQISAPGASDSPLILSIILTVGLPNYLTINMTDGPDPVSSGGNLTYILSVNNPLSGPSLSNVTLSDPLPAGMSFVSCVITGYSTSPPPSCSYSSGTVTALLSTLFPSATATVKIGVTAPAVNSPTLARNVATVWHTTNGAQTNGKSAETTTTINPLTPPAASQGGGPPGADVWALAADPVSNDTVYAGTSAGRIYRTTSGALVWTLSAVIPGLPGNAVRTLAVDPSNRNNVYAGTTGGGAIYKSSDAGQTWSALPTTGLTNTVVYALAIDSNGVVYAGTAGGGVFKSIDSGTTWSALNFGMTNLYINALAIGSSYTSVLYAGTDNGLVFKSTDGATTWNSSSSGITATSIRALVIDPTNPANVYAGASGANGGVFQSTDGGGTWIAINNGLTNKNVNALAVYPLNSALLFAATDGDLFTGSSSFWSPASVSISGQIPIHALTSNSRNVFTLYGGTRGGIIWSGFNGSSTPGLNIGLTNTFIRALAVSPSSPPRVFAASGGGPPPFTSADILFRSANGGASWTYPSQWSFSPGIGKVSSVIIDPANPIVVYAGSDTGGVFKSTDGAASWVGVLPNSLVTALAINPANTATVYAATSSQGIFKSTDGGGSWNAVNSGLTNSNVQALLIDPLNTAAVYAGTSTGVFKSTNGGASWNPASSGLGASSVLSLAIDPSNPLNVYAGTTSGIFKSTDGGGNWSALVAGPASAIAALAVDPAHPSTIYAGTSSQGGVFKSLDGGLSWVACNTGLVNAPVSSLVIVPGESSSIYAGTQGAGVVKSLDAGTTWQPTGAGIQSSPSFIGAVVPPATAISKLSGDNQTSGTGSRLSRPFVVVVTDTNGTPIAEVTVNFAVTAGGGTLSAISAVTDSQGLASSTLTLGPGAGLNTVTASSAGLAGSPVHFNSTGTLLADLTISVNDSPNPAISGGAITYSVSVQNIGGASAVDVAFTGTFREGATFQSCTITCISVGNAVTANLGTISAGGITSFNFTLTAPVVGNPTFLRTAVAVATTATESSMANNQAAASTVVNPLVVAPQGGGPPGGSIRAIAIDPRDDNTIYVGTEDNGVFKSADGGANWTGIGLIQTPVRALAIDPFNPVTLYAGAVGKGNISGSVFKSVDAGANWTKVYSGAGVPSGPVALAIDPFYSSIVYSTEVKSSNAGASWTGLGVSPVSVLAIDPNSSGTLYAGIYTGAGAVAKSIDWGATWTSGYGNAILGGLTHVSALAVDPGNPANVYAATTTLGLFKSIDGGGTFTNVNNGLTNLSTLALAIDPRHPNIVFAGTSGSGIFTSTDAGLSWTAANSGLTNLTVQVITIDPAVSSTIYAGTGAGVFKSTNGGASWISINSGIFAMAARSLTIDPANPANIYAGTAGGGAFKSTNGGRSWTAENTGLVNTNIFASLIDPSNSNTLYVGTDGGVFKSVNAGANWSYLANWNDPNNFGQFVPASKLQIQSLAIDPLTPTNLYAGLTSAAPVLVFRSTDAGQTWNASQGPFQGLSMSTMLTNVVNTPVPSVTVYAGSSNGGVYQSTNAGVSWTTLVNSFGTNELVADPIYPRTFYAGTAIGVFESTDGGSSWLQIGLNSVNITALAVDSLNDAIYAGTSDSGVFKSGPGGGNWVVKNSGLFNLSISSFATDASLPNTIYVGTGSGVYKSTDGAASWQPTGASAGGGIAPATVLSKVSGENQSGLVGQALRAPFVVVVTNAGGIPVAGVPVNFAVTAGGGGLSATSVSTDSQGVASTLLTLGPNGGTNTVTATSAGLTGSPILFNATPIGAGIAPTVTINQALGQADPTSATPIYFTVVFSEAVTGFGWPGVTLTGTAPGNKAATVTGSGRYYIVTVTGMTNSGTVIAAVSANAATGSISGTGNAASTSADNTVTFSITPLKKVRGQITSD